jgi:hypothetical protein
MTIAPTTPPATPWVIYSTPNATDPTKWDLTRSSGTVIATGVAQAPVIPMVAAFMRSQSLVDLSTLVNILAPSGNPLTGFPLPSAELIDLPNGTPPQAYPPARSTRRQWNGPCTPPQRDHRTVQQHRLRS